MTRERFEQICNDVSENMNTATKAEYREVIRRLMGRESQLIAAFHDLRSDTMLVGLELANKASQKQVPGYPDANETLVPWSDVRVATGYYTAYVYAKTTAKRKGAKKRFRCCHPQFGSCNLEWGHKGRHNALAKLPPGVCKKGCKSAPCVCPELAEA